MQAGISKHGSDMSRRSDLLPPACSFPAGAHFRDFGSDLSHLAKAHFRPRLLGIRWHVDWGADASWMPHGRQGHDRIGKRQRKGTFQSPRLPLSDLRVWLRWAPPPPRVSARKASEGAANDRPLFGAPSMRFLIIRVFSRRLTDSGGYSYWSIVELQDEHAESLQFVHSS